MYTIHTYTKRENITTLAQASYLYFTLGLAACARAMYVWRHQRQERAHRENVFIYIYYNNK